MWPSVWQMLIKLGPIRIDLSYIQLYIHWVCQRNGSEVVPPPSFSRWPSCIESLVLSSADKRTKAIDRLCVWFLEKRSHGKDNSRQAPCPGVGFCHGFGSFLQMWSWALEVLRGFLVGRKIQWKNEMMIKSDCISANIPVSLSHDVCFGENFVLINYLH